MGVDRARSVRTVAIQASGPYIDTEGHLNDLQTILLIGIFNADMTTFKSADRMPVDHMPTITKLTRDTASGMWAWRNRASKYAQYVFTPWATVREQS